MEILSGGEAYANLTRGIRQRTFRFPSKNEPGYSDGILLPKLAPRFTLEPGEKIFTIGSCFAREIETRLLPHGFDVPVAGYVVPVEEFPHGGPHLLNEYNAGTILQRIESLFGQFSYSDAMGIEETGSGQVDLFLHIHQQPVSAERLQQRRREIDDVYAQFRDSTAVVITLGLTETWFDNEYQCYLNKAPGKSMVSRFPERFAFHRMGVEDVLARMSRVIALINAHAAKKIILTVSPIPIEATFWHANAIVANSYSKSVLRVVAELICNGFPNVDYFPSYEIALSAGMTHVLDDNIHINEGLVATIIGHMLASYLPGGALPAAEPAFSVNYVDAEAHDRLGS